MTDDEKLADLKRKLKARKRIGDGYGANVKEIEVAIAELEAKAPDNRTAEA